MSRSPHALLAVAISMFLVAIISFLSGWMAAQIMERNTIPPSLMVGAEPAGNPPATAPASDDIDETFAVFWDVWRLVEREFYREEPLDDQQMTYGAIRGMLQSLGDEYTIFQEPEDAERSRESMEGSFEGIGVYMKVENGNILVDRPIRGSPAMEAGLQRGDVIVQVEADVVADFIAGLDDPAAMQEVANRIRGPKGTPVNLTIRRPADDDRVFDVAIVRDEVPLISVNYQMFENNIAYIQLTEFKATTTGELDAALRELLPQQPTSMVLDVRNNPGGYLTTAQEVLGRFYDGLALVEEMSDGRTEEFATIASDEGLMVPDMPLVVLVNGSSASASEIVAGALRDMRPNTTLLGETSFGKGSVQNIHRLRDESSVRITIARWLTPHLHEIHEVGITPDHTVAESREPQFAVPCLEYQDPPEGQETCSDAQLSWSLRLLLTGATPPPPSPEPTPVG